jgi:hypothetical protein
MANAHVACQVAHVTRPKYVSHQAVATGQVNALALGCRNASGILATMLKQQERVVEHLVHRTGRDDGDNTTHG